MNRAFESIYRAVRAIPSGRVCSYGQVADAVGVTARTVGWALATCPDDVPWHRVVGADGTLRIGRRDPALGQLQRARLQAEGVPIAEDLTVPADRFLTEAPPV
jgi:alkylated DNA nucleotide flippase Atl1